MGKYPGVNEIMFRVNRQRMDTEIKRNGLGHVSSFKRTPSPRLGLGKFSD